MLEDLTQQSFFFFKAPSLLLLLSISLSNSNPTMVGPSLDAHNLAPKCYPPPRSSSTIKFLCSYGGRILPRYPDGKLRYHGGETRVLAVSRSASFAELISKMAELSGTTVSLRCQLPTEDMDALVSITSDVDLANLIEEYSYAVSVPSGLKIRAFLSLPNKKTSPPSSLSSHRSFSPRLPKMVMSKPISSPLCMKKSAGKMPQHYGYGNRGHIYLVHNGNHWQ